VVVWTLGAWWINPELGDHRSRDHTMLYLGMGWPLIQLKSGRTSASRFDGEFRRQTPTVIAGFDPQRTHPPRLRRAFFEALS